MDTKHTMPMQALIFLPAVLLIAVVALFALSDSVQAGHSVCRADPIVYFTDGTQLTMITDLDIDVDQINKIEYTVTTPRGKVVDHIVYDVGGLGVKEKVKVIVGSGSGTYTLDQYAKTHVAANVTAIDTINSVTRSVGGRDAQHLIVTIIP